VENLNSTFNSKSERVRFFLNTATSAVLLVFYHATCMHSADYAVARCPSIRPSVCHTPVLCLDDYTYPHFFTVE